MHTFGILTPTWTVCRAKLLGEVQHSHSTTIETITKHTGMFLAVVHVISNKTLKAHLAEVFKCDTLGQCSRAFGCLTLSGLQLIIHYYRSRGRQ